LAHTLEHLTVPRAFTTVHRHRAQLRPRTRYIFTCVILSDLSWRRARVSQAQRSQACFPLHLFLPAFLSTDPTRRLLSNIISKVQIRPIY
jgi:hypothetical protein